MRRVFSVILLAGLMAGCQSESNKPPVGSPQAAAPEPAAAPVAEGTRPDESVPAPSQPAAPEAVEVVMMAGDPAADIAPRYSPPGRPLTLKPVDVPEALGVDGLETEVTLGWPLEEQVPIRLVVTRAAAGEPYTRLYVDEDRNREFNEPPVTAEPSESRGNLWSTFNVSVPISYLGSENRSETYPVSLWLTVPTAADRPDVLRISRRGYKSGDVQIGDQQVTIVLSDGNTDAILGEGDWWELKTQGETSQTTGMRTVGDFAWLGEQAWKLEVTSVTGGKVKLSPFDPGMTRAEDQRARDPYAADKDAVKAEHPLEFRHDADAAIAEAAEQKKPCFIKFETTWCGPCRVMTDLVFTAKDVVDASAGVVCVKVDGDERKDLVERFGVGGYPTGIMLAADGSEAGRFIGYQHVADMAAFLKDKRQPAAASP